MRLVRDKPNRSLNQDVNVFSIKDISQPEILFVSPTLKPVQSQTTPQSIEVASPVLSPKSAKQKSFQFDDSIKVSNVRPARDPQFNPPSKVSSEKSTKDTVQVTSRTNTFTNLFNSRPENVHVNYQCLESVNLLNAKPSRNHDKRMAHSYESFPAFNFMHSCIPSLKSNKW